MEKASIKTKPQSLLDGLDAEAQRDVVPTVFVCMSHQLTAEQEQDLHDKFGVTTYVGELSDGNDSFDQWELRVSIVTVSPELKRLTSQLPANYSLAEVQEVARAIVAEAVACEAEYFVCMGEPTLAMWANLYAGGKEIVWCYGLSYHDDGTPEQEVQRLVFTPMTCLAPTDNHIEGHKVQDDGSVATVNASKHVQWRPMF